MKIILAMILFLMTSLAFGNVENLVLPINFEVKMGELTGAGSQLSVKRLEGFIYNEQAILKGECDEILLKESRDPKISDVISIRIDNLTIDSKKLNGFIISK